MDVIEGAGFDEAAELFPYYADEGGATPEAISTAADDIVRPTGMLSGVETDLDTAHELVSTSTTGDLTALLEDAPTDAKDRISRVLGTSLVASGATRLFGSDGVAAYDSLVDDLRAEYRERKAEILASDCGIEEPTYPDDATSAERAQIDSDRDTELRTARAGEIDGLISELQEKQEKYRADPLDAEAETAAARLKEGPTDEMLVELFAAGALPSGTVDAFSDIEFRYEEPPSDLEDMSNEELATYLGEHDELLKSKDTQKLVEERIEELSAEDGEADGTTVSQWANGMPPVDGSDYEDALGNLALVSMYGAYAQTHDDIEMPDEGADYLTSFYGVVGGEGDNDDDAMDVAEWLGGDLVAEDWMVEAYANGLMVVSDGHVHPDFGFEQVPQSVLDALYDIPVKETDTDYTMGGALTTVELKGGDGFRDFAELMSHADAVPGSVLAHEMTNFTGEVAGLIAEGYENAEKVSYTTYVGFEEGLEKFAPLMQDVMEVASRNEFANQQMFADANNDDDFRDTRQTLTDLYTFPWPDDGKAVSGYTDWIADARGSGDQYRMDLATEASADFINFLTDTEGDEQNTFKTLMQGGTPDEWFYDGPPLSVGDVNPHLVESFGLVAGSNLEALGSDVPSEEHGTVYETDGTITVTEGDRSRLFSIIATDETAATSLSTTIGAYEQERLDAAIESGDPAELQDVGAEANLLDGYMAAGLYNADVIGEHGKYENAEAAYQDHMRAAAAGKAVITGGLGSIPGAGSGLSAGAGLLYDEIIAEEIPVPEEPDHIPTGQVESDHFLRGVMAYEYVSAQLRAGHDLPKVIEELAPDGELPPIEKMGSSTLSQLDDHLAEDEGWLNYIEKFQGSDPYDSASTDDAGSYLSGDDREGD